MYPGIPQGTGHGYKANLYVRKNDIGSSNLIDAKRGFASDWVQKLHFIPRCKLLLLLHNSKIRNNGQKIRQTTL
jgi:hypothetical protein